MEQFNDTELEIIVRQKLDDSGVDAELVDIKIMPGPLVVLTGEVMSHQDIGMVRQVLAEDLGITEVLDETTVVDSSDLYDDEYAEDDLLDEDNEAFGTDDVFRSVEDGVPYIPPTISPYEKKRRKRNTAF